ncbi:hypothetical protein EYC80_001787 [Monilinia laxa]|uniref:Uncharacterized protein n=1 Tax=Monilinia laxa TaxID=61186 RepID=A0A5N6K604_MONLA|nr:hypothetical protein EYC80_001787 [Monilinia laxa]
MPQNPPARRVVPKPSGRTDVIADRLRIQRDELADKNKRLNEELKSSNDHNMLFQNERKAPKDDTVRLRIERDKWRCLAVNVKKEVVEASQELEKLARLLDGEIKKNRA